MVFNDRWVTRIVSVLVKAVFACQMITLEFGPVFGEKKLLTPLPTIWNGRWPSPLLLR